jgi:hypothetical protein
MGPTPPISTSPSCHRAARKGGHVVCGMGVEAVAGPLVARRGERVGAGDSVLHVSQGDASVSSERVSRRFTPVPIGYQT